MEQLEKIIALVRSVVTGENPVAVVLGLLCFYFAYQVRVYRRASRDLATKNEKLHERIEAYLESGWHAQLAQGKKRNGPLPSDAGSQKIDQ